MFAHEGNSQPSKVDVDFFGYGFFWSTKRLLSRQQLWESVPKGRRGNQPLNLTREFHRNLGQIRGQGCRIPLDRPVCLPRAHNRHHGGIGQLAFDVELIRGISKGQQSLRIGRVAFLQAADPDCISPVISL